METRDVSHINHLTLVIPPGNFKKDIAGRLESAFKKTLIRELIEIWVGDDGRIADHETTRLIIREFSSSFKFESIKIIAAPKLNNCFTTEFSIHLSDETTSLKILHLLPSLRFLVYNWKGLKEIVFDKNCHVEQFRLVIDPQFKNYSEEIYILSHNCKISLKDLFSDPFWDKFHVKRECYVISLNKPSKSENQLFSKSTKKQNTVKFLCCCDD